MTGALRKVFMSVDAVGGVWTYALELARGLAARRIETDLAVLGPAPTGSQKHDAAEIRGVRLIRTNLPLDWTARTETELDEVAARLKELAVASGAELVHLNAPAHAGLTRWRFPLVVVAHSCVATWWLATHSAAPLPTDLGWRAQRTRSGIALSDAVIAPSHSFARQLAGVYHGDYAIHVVHNGRGLGAVPSAQARECTLTAGRLWDRAKNAGCIDQAAARLDFPVYAAGPTRGPNRQFAELRHLALLGNLCAEELESWYRRTAVFVSMSRYEPFGLSVLEAAQAGAALVLSDIETFRELWHGAAVFVPPDDPSGLANAIDLLSRNERICADLAFRARARSAKFSAEQSVNGTLRVYRHAQSARIGFAAPGSAA